MAITFVGATTTSNASQNSQTPTEHASTLQGDFMLLLGGIASSGGTWTDPADFTEIDQEDFGEGGNDSGAYVGYKIRGADAGSGYQLSSSASATQMSCALVVFRGVDQSTPLDVTYSDVSHKNEDPNSIITAAPPITTVTNGAWVVIMNRWTGAITGITQGVPTNYDSRAAILAASRSFQIATREIAVAGTETPGVWTTAPDSSAPDCINFTIALRPAGAGAAAKRRRLGMMGVG